LYKIEAKFGQNQNFASLKSFDLPLCMQNISCFWR